MSLWYMRQGQEPAPAAELGERLSISPFLQDILWRRGLAGEGEINSFLNARLADLVNPEKWPQVPEAADFLVNALLEGKKLVVWGDYDVDGTTSTALVLDVLQYHGLNAMWHIPDRHKEGYGINVACIERLHEIGCQVLLSVDSGIADVKAIARARELGMDVVVSDHHLPPDPLPPATIFFNPRMGDPETVPCPHLAGVGVAFFLMAAVNSRLAARSGRSFKMDDVLDLVALGTLADVMRLTGQNRILVRAGLARLMRPKRPGIAALKAVSGMNVNAPVSASQVSFKLAPRINAAGRMSHARVAVQLLRCRNFSDSMDLARQLDEFNTTRRDTEHIILDEARTQAAEHLQANADCGLVLYGKQWHPGIIGIVATRIIEEYHVPCIIICDDKNTLKGSGRSIPGFDLYACLSEITDHLLAFGGHRQAAGVRIMPGYLEAFRRDFQEATRRRLQTPGEQVIWVDRVLGLKDAANPVHLRELAMMEPFGPGNPEPLFLSNPVEIVSRQNFRMRHDSVELNLRDTVDGQVLHAKGWGMADKFPPEMVGTVIRIVFTLRSEMRLGLSAPELTIKDFKLCPDGSDGLSVPPSENTVPDASEEDDIEAEGADEAGSETPVEAASPAADIKSDAAAEEPAAAAGDDPAAGEGKETEV